MRLLECEGISKAFPGVKALDNVDFHLLKGEVHALIGENGAGKSTLIKILGGLYRSDSGVIRYKGKEVFINSPRQSQQLGIAIIHQELSLVPSLSVAENVFLGREPCSNNVVGRYMGRIRWRDLVAETQKILDLLSLNIQPDAIVGTLSVAQQQMVEVARALSKDADVIIMDEPTTALSAEEAERLLELVRGLRKRGIAVVYISHRLDEVFEVSDRITVLRDGKNVGTRATSRTSIDEVVSMMVGRAIENRYPKTYVPIGEVILEVKELSRRNVLKDISFSVHRGEILGIAGLVGSGRTELARVLFGADRITSGSIFINSQPVNIASTLDAVKNGIALIPEDRKSHGLLVSLSVRENISLPNLDALKRRLRIMRSTELGLANKMVRNLGIRTPSLETAVKYLSGGNQQKVVLAKWMCCDSHIFLFDEPTKGIDVAAKVEVYELIQGLCREGAGVILISSELEEVMALSDRLLVMREGRISAEFNRDEYSREKIMLAATVGDK